MGAKVVTGGRVEHSPDSPFGCAATFGPPLGGRFPSGYLLHVCNGEPGHTGLHRCRCGALRPRTVKDPR